MHSTYLFAEERSERRFKFLTLGDSAVGKTTWVHRYVQKELKKFRPTIGVDLIETTKVNNVSTILYIILIFNYVQYCTVRSPERFLLHAHQSTAVICSLFFIITIL